MKIDTTARIANLAHQDYFVRNTLLDCCLKFGDTDIRVTQQAMIAIDSYGIEQAYEYPHKLRVLALDEAAADWLIALIDQLDSKTHFGNNCLAHFVDWFVSKAPTSSLVKYRAHIINLPANNQQFKRNNPDEELTIRAELNALTSDQAYQKIVSQLETLDEYTSFKEANIPQLERLIQQLDPSDDSLKQNILTKLQSTLPEPGSDKAFQAHYWDFGIWVIASGYLKIDQAIPTLLAGINYDWDWLNELIPEAIVKIGSEAALKLTTDLCLQSQQESAKMNDAYDYKRTFLTCVFEKVESPLSAALAQKLLINEREEFALSSLAEAIAVQLDGESIHHALAVYNEYPNEPEFGHLIGYFYTHAILTDSTPSDLDQWKDKLDQERKSSFQMRHQGYSEDSMLAQLMQRQNSSPFKFPKYAPAKEIPTYIRTEAKINRNDPCPCGSGQKYKRCCIN